MTIGLTYKENVYDHLLENKNKKCGHRKFSCAKALVTDKIIGTVVNFP